MAQPEEEDEPEQGWQYWVNLALLVGLGLAVGLAVAWIYAPCARDLPPLFR